jgi:hypothetical protein
VEIKVILNVFACGWKDPDPYDEVYKKADIFDSKLRRYRYLITGRYRTVQKQKFEKAG